MAKKSGAKRVYFEPMPFGSARLVARIAGPESSAAKALREADILCDLGYDIGLFSHGEEVFSFPVNVDGQITTQTLH